MMRESVDSGKIQLEPKKAEPMEEMRSDPDALLEHMERRPFAGRLKIFFGYAAGVEKTYAMLEGLGGLPPKRGERRQLGANLFWAISYDLRTPLTSISGNAGILMENGAALNAEKRRGLSARPFGGQVLVKVADDGPGIPDEAKGKIFDMFYTAGNARGDGRRGLSLGLSLRKSIVSAYGGVIAVTDNQPRGACFSFTLHVSEVEPHE